ncbi:hypothetical protein ITP53_29675 [Nonomuraea sp. K274]|uniref:CSLREA domain-containing protein n=1 Tax=Nonomuraea cypriaca TaxID=1187855 RepID=A0A931ABJ8_9ACTN|nr:hypothetical protein [Nonomuraea cypriaca]MBF8189821.1 hypothetical protein [Nonomuraea cypriaca]
MPLLGWLTHAMTHRHTEHAPYRRSSRVAVALVPLALTAVGAASPVHVTDTVPCGDTARLIAAVQAANASGGTVHLAPRCTYTLTAPFGTTANGLPTIINTVLIEGNGSTIARAATAPPFRILEVTVGGDLTLRRVTVRGGQASGSGGGIHSSGGVLRLIASTVTGNTATNFGGGLDAGSTLIVENGSRIIGNSGREGGGITSFGPTSVTNSTISGNTARRGGGIFTAASGDRLTIRNTRIERNTVETDGGGISHAIGLMDIRDSRIDHNSAGTFGGGISNAGGTVSVTLGSISGNTSAGDGGGIRSVGPLTLEGAMIAANRATGPSARGGGIASHATLTMTRSVVTRNTAGTAPGGLFNAAAASVTAGAITANRPTNCTQSPVPVAGCLNNV